MTKMGRILVHNAVFEVGPSRINSFSYEQEIYHTKI